MFFNEVIQEKIINQIKIKIKFYGRSDLEILKLVKDYVSDYGIESTIYILKYMEAEIIHYLEELKKYSNDLNATDYDEKDYLLEIVKNLIEIFEKFGVNENEKEG